MLVTSSARLAARPRPATAPPDFNHSVTVIDSPLCEVIRVIVQSWAIPRPVIVPLIVVVIFIFISVFLIFLFFLLLLIIQLLHVILLLMVHLLHMFIVRFFFFIVLIIDLLVDFLICLDCELKILSMVIVFGPLAMVESKPALKDVLVDDILFIPR